MTGDPQKVTRLPLPVCQKKKYGPWLMRFSCADRSESQDEIQKRDEKINRIVQSDLKNAVRVFLEAGVRQARGWSVGR
jgi:hypothetical protein